MTHYSITNASEYVKAGFKDPMFEVVFQIRSKQAWVVFDKTNNDQVRQQYLKSAFEVLRNNVEI